MQDIENLTESGLKLGDIAMDFVLKYGPKILGAIAVLVIGLWIISWVLKIVNRMMTKASVDDSLRTFIKSLISVLLKIMLGISILGMMGIEMTSFIAILASAGLAVGLALSGTLQNFAGGVMILFFKPFKVGDVIQAEGHIGSVKAIQIFVTILTTPDNKTIIIPNGPLSNGSLVNFSTQENRRVDWVFGIGYGDDLDKAKGIIREILESDERVHKDPEVFIALGELGDSSVNITVRVWVEASNYWGVFFDTNEKVYHAFNAKGINIPFPQMDVHVHNK